MHPDIPYIRLNKEQENAILYFYMFLKSRGYDIDGDTKDDFYDFIQLNNENKEMLDEMDKLELE